MVEFAPLFIPFSRRFQTLAVFTTSLIAVLGPIIGTLTFILMLFTPFAIFSIIYAGVFFLWDFDLPSRGGRRFNYMRQLSLWKYFCNYFPIRLVKTIDLDPSKSYIFGYHPHGIISNGAFGCFATEGTDFSKLFPKITPHLLTLKVNFRWPLHRDFLLSLGICDVSKESIRNICNKAGNAAIIVVGGAAEALEAFPGSTTLTLLNRKGFVKMALKTGASLVPIYSFGENDLHKQAKHPLLRIFQEKVRSFSGVSPVLFYGRGIFQYSFGLMPFRVPVTTVVGSPIHVKKTENPSQEEIDALHREYIKELESLYNTYKEKYSRSPDAKLKFV